MPVSDKLLITVATSTMALLLVLVSLWFCVVFALNTTRNHSDRAALVNRPGVPDASDIIIIEPCQAEFVPEFCCLGRHLYHRAHHPQYSLGKTTMR